MDKNEFLEVIKQIGTEADDVQRRTMLTELSDKISGIFDSNTELMEKNKSFEEDNEKLRSANMQLFLRVGANKSEEEIQKNQVGDTDSVKEPRKFENLFDENGNLK